jgi:hypothetical protein
MVCHGWDLGSEALTLPELIWLQSNLYGKATEAPNGATSALFRPFGYDSFPWQDNLLRQLTGYFD